MTNICTKCKKCKPFEAFGINNSRANGLAVHCKECRRNRKKSKKPDEIVGKKFERLLVLEKTEEVRSNSPLYICLCDCGNKKTIRRSDIRDGSVKSCGCLAKERCGGLNKLPIGEAAFNGLFLRYQIRAKKLKCAFSIEKLRFRELINKKCYYCHALPGNHVYKAHNGDLPYNGLDRKDTALGYTAENVVTCCAECNWMKRTMSIESYFKKIKDVALAHNLLK